jgi:LmbE family N-acetylglucosaminyl deacetylase
MFEIDIPHPVSDVARGGTTLLGIWAHPDDEAYLAGGLMTRVASNGGRVVVAFATRGEAGTDDPAAFPPAELARRREAEARDAVRLLGAEPPAFLGHADGGCRAVDLAVGAAQVEALIDDVDPDVIVTFGRDGITGHDDHRAVSAWTIAAWQAVRRRRARTPRLLLPALAPRFVERHRRLHDEIGFFGPDGPLVTPDGELTLRVRLSEAELDRKVAALAAHASQTTALSTRLGREAYRAWWAEECFRGPDAIELGAASTEVAA